MAVKNLYGFGIMVRRDSDFTHLNNVLGPHVDNQY